ncbi:MAG: hypothetical protein IKV20_03775 [Clostridia bacterium]|nr:hypothetical protein [Clostridia bacterium]
MNKDKNLEDLLLDPGDALRRSGLNILGDVGKLVAVITLIVACLVTFTDISFYEIGSKEFTSTLIMMLIGAYLMFFSLEESGERHGERTEDFTEAKDGYRVAVSKIFPSDITPLEKFLEEKREIELLKKRQSYLKSLGYTQEILFLPHKPATKDERRALRRAMRIKQRAIRPGMLLERDGAPDSTELYNPTAKKLLRIVMKLIPTSACMVFTASVMLSAKGELTAGVIIESLLRLSALPIVGFRGYAFGYRYTKNIRACHLREKTRILEAYLAEKITA